MVKKERWALPLQVDNMYTRGGVGELRGGGREGVKIEQIERVSERKVVEADCDLQQKVKQGKRARRHSVLASGGIKYLGKSSR